MNSPTGNANPISPIESCSTRSRWWRLPLLLSIVLAAIVALRGGIRREISEGGEETPPPSANNSAAESEHAGALHPTEEAVSLSIDFGDGEIRTLAPVAWRDGMTVADQMASSAYNNRALKLIRQGSGAMTFLTDIEGVSNEGAGGRNWTYTVNEEKADRSYAIYELRPGDRVLWTFAPAE